MMKNVLGLALGGLLASSASALACDAGVAQAFNTDGYSSMVAQCNTSSGKAFVGLVMYYASGSLTINYSGTGAVRRCAVAYAGDGGTGGGDFPAQQNISGPFSEGFLLTVYCTVDDGDAFGVTAGPCSGGSCGPANLYYNP